MRPLSPKPVQGRRSEVVGLKSRLFDDMLLHESLEERLDDELAAKSLGDDDNHPTILT